MIDADYVKHMSLWSDLKIMFLTPVVMVRGKVQYKIKFIKL